MRKEADMTLYEELSEYLHKPVTPEQCKAASFGLVWEWANKESVLDYYRHSHLYVYDLTFYQTMLRSIGFKEWYESFFEQIHPKTGLDLGGGIGEYTIIAEQHGCKMDFVDVDGETLKYARWRFQKYGVSPVIHTEDFKIDKDYDFIIAMDVLEHIEEPEPRIKEFAEHTEWLFANPGEVQYNDLYPQHISRYDLTPYFYNVQDYLWRRK